MKHAWWLMLAVACGPSTVPKAEAWTTREFLKKSTTDALFGGIPTRRLGVNEGAVIPWREKPFEAQDSVQLSGRGLPVWPAFADGKTASMLITEIWQNHPTPWVQPVYQFRTDGKPRPDLRGIFAVGVDSTFYTPFWRAEWAAVGADTGSEAFTSVTSVLDSKVAVTRGAMVVCPIVPNDVLLASADGTTAVRPLTGEPVPSVTRAEAWVDGTVVNYLGVGINRQTVTENALPIETPMYFFVRADGQGYSLPPILPADPTKHSLHRRYNVVLPSSAGVFVPPVRTELRQLLADEGAPVPAADPLIAEETSRPYLLRVATNPSCFTKAAEFPSSCHWLDSQVALEAAIGQDVRVRTEVLITASTLQVGAL